MDENITNVFISYAHEDAVIANAIRDQLTLLAQGGKGGTLIELLPRHRKHSTWR